MNKLLFVVFFALSLFLIGCTSLIEYEIYFDSNNGDTLSMVTTDGSSVIRIPQNPTKEGYIFVGWFWDNDTFNIPFTANSLLDQPIRSDMTVYAKWIEEEPAEDVGNQPNDDEPNDSGDLDDISEKQVTLDFDPRGGLLSEEHNQIIAITGTEINLPIPTRENYTFAGWFTDIQLTQEFTPSIMPNQNLKLYAKWYTQGVTDTQILIGNTIPTSGGLAFVGGPFRDAMIAYFNMVNEQGGIAGREIAYIQYDDGFDGAQGLALTQRLVEVDRVFALVGHFGTPTVGATRSYLNDIGILRVYYATGISALFNPEAEGGARASFPVQPIFDAEGEVMVARAVGNLGAQRVGVIYTNDDAGRGLLNGIRIRSEMLGLTLVEAQVAPDSSDMSTAAQTMLSGNVDVVLLAANQVPASVAARALAAAGSTTPVVTSYVNADATWLNLIAEVLGSFDVYTSAWIDVAGDMDSLNSFITEVSKIDPALVGNAFAFAGWIAAATFVEGLRRVGDGELTWESYIQAMESAPVELPFGIIVDYTNNRRVGTQAMAFLKASSNNGVLAWQTLQPIQTIQEMLE